MGTVFRARDRRTRTVVAVKLLHPHLAQDRHYVERFRREAKIAKSLDSVHIVKVLDVGDHDGQPFIVMEYVPGPTLREALEAKRRFSSEEALALCVQIVEALQEAYRKGVVHRDIKPQNIILTAEGLAKVADFGVAKAEELSTITLTGSFFGTLQYAAPERFEGEGDIRSDIYSVGIILYQMLTGTVPFAADSALVLIRLHNEQPPAPLSQHVPHISDDVQALVSRCLAKRPGGRFQDPAELASALSSILPEPEARAALARISLPKRRSGLRAAASRWWSGHRRPVRTALSAGVAVVVVAGASLGAVWALRGTGPRSDGVVAWDPWAFGWVGSTTPPATLSPTEPGGEGLPCLAAADRIAYTDEAGDVWFVDSDGTNATRLTESGNNSELAFSPDGRRVAYVHVVGTTDTGVAIPEMRVVSGREVVLLDPRKTFPSEFGVFTRLDNVRWTTDGARVLAHVAFGGASNHYIGAFPVDLTLESYFLGGPGGKPTTTPWAETELWAYNFDVHPISGDIAYVMHSNADPYGYYLAVADPDGSKPRYVLLPRGAPEPSYASPSWSPVSQDIALYVGREGTYSLAVVGSEAAGLGALARELVTMGSGKPTDRPRWSPDGASLAYDDGAAIWVVDATDASEPRELANGTHPTWSPDGSEIAYESAGTVWVIAASGGEPRQVTLGSDPEWSPDASVCVTNAEEGASLELISTPTPPPPPTPTPTPPPTPTLTPGPGPSGRIAFTSYRDGNWEIYVMNANGSGQTRLTNNPARDWDPASSPDGSQIAFTSDRDGNPQIYMMNADGSGQTRLTNNTAYDERPAWSPHGSRIAFTSSRDGNDEIYAMNADGSGQTRLTNNSSPDFDPAWSPDGSKIAFESDRDGNMEVYVMNADGSGQTRLTNNPARDMEPAWSPDGSKMAFESDRDGNLEVYVMNADGSGQTLLTNDPADDWAPAWSP